MTLVACIALVVPVGYAVLRVVRRELAIRHVKRMVEAAGSGP